MIFKSILAAMMLASAAYSSIPAWSMQPSGHEGAENPQFNTSGERIGELHLGQPEKEVNANIPCKPRKDKEELEGATGDYVQRWQYLECGIELKMGSMRKSGTKTVKSITVTSPSKLQTTQGIHIGSTQNEVVKVYGQYRDPEESRQGEQFVAGSIFDGLIFLFEKGKVVSIFLGAAAE